MHDEALTRRLSGRELDTAVLREHGWYEQAGAGHHYGLPRAPGLWVRRLEPMEQCECMPVMLFVLLQLGRTRRVRDVLTMVCQCFPDGHYDEIPLPVAPWDSETAAREAELAAKAKEARKRQRR